MAILMRFIHIASAVVAVGGVAFMVFCAVPVGRQADEDLGAQIVNRIESRFRVVMSVAIVGLLVSGFFNWVAGAGVYRQVGAAGNAFLGVKVLLAVLLMGLLWARRLGVGAATGDRIWRLTVLLLAAAVILLGATVRTLRLESLTTPGG